MSTCFIAMPITCPESAMAQYINDKDHFLHVLNHLFIPAIQKAQLEPTPPIASGSDLIHAEIVKQLESADLVLCDMSCLNPNVFFELGIRTAVDKPICLVKDIFVDKVPFDTGVLNYLTYDPSLSPWKLSNEIQKLTEHILASLNRSQGRNTLWRHFGLTTRAELSQVSSPIEGKLDLVLDRLAAIERSGPSLIPLRAPLPEQREKAIRWIINNANIIAEEVSAQFTVSKIEGDVIVLDLEDFAMERKSVERVQALGADYGISISVIGGRIVE